MVTGVRDLPASCPCTQFWNSHVRLTVIFCRNQDYAISIELLWNWFWPKLGNFNKTHQKILYFWKFRELLENTSIFGAPIFSERMNSNVWPPYIKKRLRIAKAYWFLLFWFRINCINWILIFFDNFGHLTWLWRHHKNFEKNWFLPLEAPRSVFTKKWFFRKVKLIRYQMTYHMTTLDDFRGK